MKNKTDAELIEEAERMEAQPYAKIGPNRVLCAQLARRLKSANEKFDQMESELRGDVEDCQHVIEKLHTKLARYEDKLDD